MPPTPTPSGERLRQELRLKVVTSPETQARTPDLLDADYLTEAFLSGKTSPSHQDLSLHGGSASDVCTQSIAHSFEASPPKLDCRALLVATTPAIPSRRVYHLPPLPLKGRLLIFPIDSEIAIWPVL